jgi:hypothetical protein
MAHRDELVRARQRGRDAADIDAERLRLREVPRVAVAHVAVGPEGAGGAARSSLLARPVGRLVPVRGIKSANTDTEPVDTVGNVYGEYRGALTAVAVDVQHA